MLKTVFIGSKNDFDEILVDWLSKRTRVVGTVWTNLSSWRKSAKQRNEFIRRRLKKYGLFKVADEATFYLWYRKYQQDSDMMALRRDVIEPYHEAEGVPAWKGDAIMVRDVNAPETLAFIRDRSPDLALAMCINARFEIELRTTPRYGVFLWHEGITPEYRGLYSPFWALHNLDFERIGYTLLRMNDRLDAGEIYVQGQADVAEPTAYGHTYLGHKAIYDSLPSVDVFLRELEAGKARPIVRQNARDAYYTYPGITDLIRMRRRLRANERSMSSVAA